jgi:integrase
MAGKVQEARLDSVARRTRLKRGRQPHWRALHRDPDRSVISHLGYQRWPEDKAGRWLLRQYREGKYSITPLGAADDAETADGHRVLSYHQAEANALAQAGAPRSRSARLTVRQALAAYIEFKRSQGQLGAVAYTEKSARAHILPVLGEVAVADLTAERLRKWLAALAATPARVRTKTGAPQQYQAEPTSEEDVRRRRASANRILTMVKAALNYCYDEGLTGSNTAWGRRVKPFREVDVARVRYLTVAEAQRLINACHHAFRPLVQAALFTGCRYGELIRLQGHDFNPAAGSVTIRKSKSGRPRHVILTDEGIAFFKQVTAGRAGNELMFTRADGSPWGKSDQLRPMAEACDRAGIKPPIGFHILRHTFASLAVMGGVPLQVVARALGHAPGSKMCEKHYAHLAPSYEAEAIRNGAPKFGFKPDKKIVAFAKERR